MPATTDTIITAHCIDPAIGIIPIIAIILGAAVAYTDPAITDIAKPTAVKKFAVRPKEAKVMPIFDIIGSREPLNLLSNNDFNFLTALYNKFVSYLSYGIESFF